MVRLHYEYTGSMFSDGAGSHKELLDISEKLSEHYGRLIRQGQVFRIRKIEARIFNPNTAVQDVIISCAGNYVYMSPTGNRRKAWLMALKSTNANRRLLGNIHKSSKNTGYDFRVGLHPNYSTDVGIFGEGVKYNAWIQSDAEPLHLAGHASQGIFDVFNEDLTGTAMPVNPGDGFGTWIDKNLGATGDELDFVTNENPFYVTGSASPSYEYAPFSCAFSSVYDSALDAKDSIGTVTTPSVTEGPIFAMCGLIGVNIDTTGSDDSASQLQDYGIQIIVDVESWSPIVKSKRSKKNGRRKSKK